MSLAGSINAVDNVFEPIDKLWGKRINQWLKINHWITFWSSKSRHHIFRFHVYNVYTHQTSFNYSSMCITYAHISHCFSRTNVYNIYIHRHSLTRFHVYKVYTFQESFDHFFYVLACIHIRLIRFHVHKCIPTFYTFNPI